MPVKKKRLEQMLGSGKTGRASAGVKGSTGPLRLHACSSQCVKLVWCLRNNYRFAAMDFGRRLGASDEHIPQWICKERATTPPPKRHAALRVALKLAWGFVAQSVEYRCGYTPSFAPRPRPI